MKRQLYWNWDKAVIPCSILFSYNKTLHNVWFIKIRTEIDSLTELKAAKSTVRSAQLVSGEFFSLLPKESFEDVNQGRRTLFLHRRKWGQKRTNVLCQDLFNGINTFMREKPPVLSISHRAHFLILW